MLPEKKRKFINTSFSGIDFQFSINRICKTIAVQTLAKKIDVVDTDSLKNFRLAELKLESSNAKSFCSLGVSGAALLLERFVLESRFLNNNEEKHQFISIKQDTNVIFTHTI